MVAFKILATALLSLAPLVLSQPTTATPIKPNADYAFSVFINLKPTYIADGPYGERVNVGYVNGTITGANGKIIGTVLPGVGSENAIIDSLSYVHLNARVTGIMTSDNETVYITLQGVGTTKGDVLFCQGYMVLEGNTTTFPSLNSDTFIYTLRRSFTANTSQMDVFKLTYPGLD